MSNQEMAKEIMGLVGGEKNVSQLTHCATRLRFVLADDSKADLKKLGAVEGVITAQNRGGQVQVVIGAKVDRVYDEILKSFNVQAGGTVDDNGEAVKKKNLFNTVLETIAGIFTPILPALVGCGMMQCLTKIMVQMGVPADNGVIVIADMIGACIFYFMPFFLAGSAARKFKTNEAIAICLAACYMHPTIMNAESAISFLGLPLKNMSYASTVIPIILSVFVLKYVYDFVNKVIPDVVKVILVPMVTLIIMVPLQLALLGPIGSYFGTGVSKIILVLFDLNGAIAGAFLGFFRPILVMFGMHYSIMPMQIQQVAELGYTVMTPSALCANLAQAGAAFGVALRAKNKTMKAAGSSTGFTALFGITEPAIYGVTLRYKKPFFAGCAAAGLASGFLGMVNGRATSIALPGILSLPVFEANSFAFVLIGAAAAFVLAMVFTVAIGFDED